MSTNPWQTLSALAERLHLSLGQVLVRLIDAGHCNAQGLPTPSARKHELARWANLPQAAGTHWLWHGGRLAPLFTLPPGQRTRPVPQWKQNGPFDTLSDIGARVGLSSAAMGQRLRRAGWRRKDGLPTEMALNNGWCQVVLSQGGFAISRWHRKSVMRHLNELGHPIPDSLTQDAQLAAFHLRRGRDGKTALRRTCAKGDQRETVARATARLAPEHTDTLANTLRRPAPVFRVEVLAETLDLALPAGAPTGRARL